MIQKKLLPEQFIFYQTETPLTQRLKMVNVQRRIQKRVLYMKSNTGLE